MPWATPPNFTTGNVVTEQELDTLSTNLSTTTHNEITSANTQDIQSGTETSLISHTLPANRLSTNRALRITILGNYEHSADIDLTLRLTFGANTLTLIMESTFVTGTPLFSSFPFEIVAWVANVGATNSQYASIFWRSGGRWTGATSEQPSFRTAGGAENYAIDNGDILWTNDTTASVAVNLTAQWQSAGSIQLLKRYGTIELLGS